MTIEIDKKVFYTTKEFAQLFRYADTQPVRRWCANGAIPSIKRMDGSYLIRGEYVEMLLRKSGVKNGLR